MRINTLELFNFRNIETSHISFKDKKFVVLILEIMGAAKPRSWNLSQRFLLPFCVQ